MTSELSKKIAAGFLIFKEKIFKQYDLPWQKLVGTAVRFILVPEQPFSGP